MLCLLRYEGKKMENKKIKIKIPYKIQFDLQLSLNPEVPDLLRICWWMRMESFICLFYLKKKPQISQRQSNKNWYGFSSIVVI